VIYSIVDEKEDEKKKLMNNHWHSVVAIYPNDLLSTRGSGMHVYVPTTTPEEASTSSSIESNAPRQ
jgi:hypothetical protein